MAKNESSDNQSWIIAVFAGQNATTDQNLFKGGTNKMSPCLSIKDHNNQLAYGYSYERTRTRNFNWILTTPLQIFFRFMFNTKFIFKRIIGQQLSRKSSSMNGLYLLIFMDNIHFY